MIYDRNTASAYVDVIIDQIGKLKECFPTVYIGGGTPSVLDMSDLGRLLSALRPRLDGSSEFTIEANPDSLDNDRVKLFMDYGVNRLSIGVQSLDDRKLKRLGRIHNMTKARESVNIAAKRGLSNISIDLMFGIWDEKPGDWKKELGEVVKLPIKHISCYSLTYEKDTPLFKALCNNSIKPIGDDIACEMYETAIDMLALGRFKQYEISSFAMEGFRCRHNESYWENNPYIGLGASAVSYIDGVRSRNIASVKEYIKRCESLDSLVESSEKLSSERRAKETAAVKIRTRDGIDFKWFKDSTGYDLMRLERKAIDDLVKKELIKYKREGDSISGITLKRRGVLLCDMVSSEFL